MPQPRWLEPAWADLGVAEAPGPESNARVLSYYADIGHAHVRDDEVAWCAAFLGACLERAGIKSTRSLAARSYLDWGEPIPEFRYGAIAVLSRGPDPALGHVGFLIGETGTHLILLGGNQENAVGVEAFARSRLVALRWPASVIPDGASAPIRDPHRDALFERALAHVLDMEGGYTDDPHDPGGPTNFGITLADYARERRVEVTADNLGQLKAELKRIAPDLVRHIYLERYWRPARCPDLPAALALFHFDTAVNQGLAAAARLLQEAVGAAIDGEIGPETLAAASSRTITETLAGYAELRRRRYRSLATFWRFGKGWLTRVDRTLALATGIARATRARLPSQPQEKRPMTDATGPHTPAAGKWWGQSVTIWGAVVTTLSTVLPALGPIIGLDITADLVQQLGDKVVEFGQAAGGLLGVIMTIYGRFRASRSLQRRQFTLHM